jgi:integrase
MKSHSLKNADIVKIRRNLYLYYRDIFDIMLFTGLRVGDVLNARFSDLDTKGYLHYTAQKTGKKARVKLPADIVTSLEKRRTGDGFLFPSPVVPDKAISRQAVWQHIKSAAKDARVSLAGVSPHSLRKTFAVDTFKKEGFGAVMSKLQHSDPSTTYLYVYDESPFQKLDELEERVKRIETVVRSYRKLLDRLLYAIDLCCDKLIGNDVYGVTNEGRKLLKELTDFDGNI